ncbi:DUF2953 family protein [Hydrogenispora ethanolica]|uniref:DUF2953 family protein n=1 Tax=Hydrogenispora ethanolica TaxID=1082276 RepID=A0A4R1RRF5_HYDET|nr:DUF2953 domain-containing protein [Hydrogenispora ethanolica]TCL68522.1 DUF2953 family protein [Hydrogenispora ethanolica]
MVELVLFIGSICLFFFVPVQFRVYYRKIGPDDHLLYEMVFLGGLLKRRKEVTLLQPTPAGIKQKTEQSGHWLWFRRAQVTETISPFQGNSRGLREFLHRYQEYGLGITLLSYFLPAKYQHWLLVAEDLERRGRFERFRWYTRFGTGEAASTAIVYGLLWGLKATLAGVVGQRSRFARPPEIRIIPDYQALRLDMLFDCIFKVKLGYIMIAAFIVRVRYRLKGGVGFERASN